MHKKLEILQVALTLFVDNRVMIGPEVCVGIVLDWNLLLLVTVSFQFPINIQYSTFSSAVQAFKFAVIHTSQPAELAFSLVHS